VIFDPLDFKRIAAQIAFNLCRVLGAHHAAVATLPIETGDLIFTTASGAAPVGLENLLSGASRLAVREGRPDATPDVLADPRFEWTEAMRSQLERVPYRALLHVPVTLGGTMIGLLLVGDRVGRVFDEDAIELACMFADQTAIALESARLGREARRRQRETDLLAALATEMDGSLDLGTLLQRIVDGVIDLISCDQAAIRLREPDGGMALHARAHRAGITPMPAVHRIESGKGAGGFVLLTGQPLRTGDYAADPRITRDYVETVRASGTAALMVMPIRLGGSIEGLLYAMNRSARPFTEGDEAALLRLAGHAAVALRQATLLTAEQHARQEVEMLSRKFVEVQDAERSHLAGELHDQVGQLLTVLQLTLSPGTPCPDGVITDRLAKANDIVVDLIRRIRKLSVDLRPR
jgi:GAF domain-containing protein